MGEDTYGALEGHERIMNERESVIERTERASAQGWMWKWKRMTRRKISQCIEQGDSVHK